jgi:hypothetical protein
MNKLLVIIPGAIVVVVVVVGAIVVVVVVVEAIVVVVVVLVVVVVVVVGAIVVVVVVLVVLVVVVLVVGIMNLGKNELYIDVISESLNVLSYIIALDMDPLNKFEPVSYEPIKTLPSPENVILSAELSSNTPFRYSFHPAAELKVTAPQYQVLRLRVVDDSTIFQEPLCPDCNLFVAPSQKACCP